MFDENHINLFVSGPCISAAVDCPKDCSCLNGGDKDLCRVISTINDEILYVVCLNGESCPYKGRDRERAYCSCPVRKEIYNKYKI